MLTFDFEVERAHSSVEYVAEYTVTPGEKEIRWGDNACPGSDPEVEDVEVFYLRRVSCAEHRFKVAPRYCKECKVIKEPRPEMAELIDTKELLEASGEEDGGRDWDNERKSRLENRE